MLGVSVALMDVTEQKRLEHLLREKEEHFRHILSLHPSVHWILDTDGKVIEAEAGWEDLTGQKLEDALGDGWLSMVHPNDLATTMNGIRITLNSGQPPTTDFRVRRRDGDWARVRVRGLPRRGLSGEAICFYGVLEVLDDSSRMDGVD
jgi:PAS domain S-box-containing protein